MTNLLYATVAVAVAVLLLGGPYLIERLWGRTGGSAPDPADDDVPGPVPALAEQGPGGHCGVTGRG
jgi:hypothetical protein